MLYRSAALSVLVATTAFLFWGCGDSQPAPTPADVDFSVGADVYHVRGVIESLPAEGPPPSDLRIHHEHIPGFIGQTGGVHVNPDGVPGMKAMVMDFPLLAPGVSLEGLSPGDAVEFELRVKWEESAGGVKSPRWQVGSIKRLPEDAVVSFENKP